jgi:hypothetical protein
MDRPGEAHPHAQHPVAVRARGAQDELDHLGRVVDPGGGVVVVGHLAPLLGEELVGEIREGDREVALAEVDANREARSGIQGDRRRRAAPAAWRASVRIAVDHDPLGLEGGHDRRNGRARQARVACHVGAACDPQDLQRLDHAQPVRLA